MMLLTEAEAADWLRCSVSTLRRHVAARDIECVRPGPKRILFTGAALEAFVQSRTIPAKPFLGSGESLRHQFPLSRKAKKKLGLVA